MGHEFDIGVIGGGAAGLSAAAGAARLGMKAILIEREPSLGGDCLHYGCVPSKTLISSAHVYHLIKNARMFGLPEAAIAPVDFRGLAVRIHEVIGRIQKHDSDERFRAMGVAVEHGAPEFADANTVALGGRLVSARQWVIATGSSAMTPPINGLDTTPYITNRELFSLDRLPASMAIIGGGPIAIEMAQAFARLGTRVTVIEQAPQILPREDRDMAGALMAALRAEGVEFHLGARVLRVANAGPERELVIESAGAEFPLRADTILVAAGRKPNVDGLGLGRIGVAHSARGVEVNARMKTSVPHIYAAGDVTGQYLFTHAAGYEAGIVIANAAFRVPRRADYARMPWCTYTDPELASIGINERSASGAGIKYTVWTEEFASNDRALAEGSEAGRVKLLLDRRGRPIGAQVLGPRAGELIAEWAAVFASGMSVASLAGAVHPYPTLAEINKRAAGSVIGARLFSPRVKRLLRILFRYRG